MTDQEVGSLGSEEGRKFKIMVKVKIPLQYEQEQI